MNIPPARRLGVATLAQAVAFPADDDAIIFPVTFASRELGAVQLRTLHGIPPISEPAWCQSLIAAVTNRVDSNGSANG
jgi:hypothetical protein